MATSGVMPHFTARLTLAAALAVVWAPIGVRSQFGGGYNPPPPNCPAFQCAKDEKPVGKVEHQIWSYGCKESGMSFLNTASFDPSNPLKGLQQKSVDKCCVERDICKQTCGMSAKACHENFQKCSKKICKGDQNCEMQAMLSEIMSEPYDEAERDPDKKFDPEESKCRGYNRGQKEACQCVPKDEWQAGTDSKLKAFYGKFNPEKLGSDGEIKDLDEVWKKWKGKEAEMFLALATKYKEKAVEIRVKPTPPPYKPPPPKDQGEDAEQGWQPEDLVPEEEAPAAAEKAQKPAETTDPEAEAFDKTRRDFEAKKRKAAEDEDYDLAQSLKEDLRDITKREVDRLKDLKKKAIADEDYQGAKKIKSRIEKLDL